MTDNQAFAFHFQAASSNNSMEIDSNATQQSTQAAQGAVIFTFRAESKDLPVPANTTDSVSLQASSIPGDISSLEALPVTQAREAVRIWVAEILDATEWYREPHYTTDNRVSWDELFANPQFLALCEEIKDTMPKIMAWGCDLTAVARGEVWRSYKGRLWAKHVRDYKLDSREMERAYQFFLAGCQVEGDVPEAVEGTLDALAEPYDVWCYGGRKGTKRAE
ncbi:hypothetical protein LTR56_008977 [Elasticomyces elasticus]|nr:hypothetical protein LTR22_024621 [Elasticomyces elasticus]KAK3645790.1 hypothetical protein LTR56_008977 [Elasticomyces elasticus]KAK4924104.1 hypothetical protein LTR49_008844 [Elasticomyces elasticus]KAK5764463.1 hypothetical protein LTS12_005439 [Elasticomyces elasticus]